MLKDFFTTLGTGALDKVLHAVLVLVIGLLIIRVVTKLLQGGLEKSHLEKAAHSLILSLAKVAMYILLGLSVASSLGIDVTGIVALASVLTLAVSLSLQNMLTNVIGGFTILSTHPFHSGDYVEIAGQSGTVQEINMTYTRLATFDNKLISIPNSAVVAAQIVNYSAADTRRVDIPVSDWGIDFLVSSANKCIQGVPGFSFILCRRDKLLSSEGKARSLSLDLLDQWKGMEKDGKWRFTSPTHVVLAFSKALDELEAEGGIPARHRRYAENNRLLIEKMRAMGFAPYIDGSRQGPIITTFFYPAGVPFQFSEFYTYIKERGYVLYPGKLTDADTFRVGNIGEIYPEDIEKLASIIAGFLAAHKEEIA